MATKSAAAVFQLPLFLFVFLTAAAAHNITAILGDFDGFSSFNNLLNQTKLNDEINRRQTITVLAVDDSAISPLASLQGDALKKALSVHVILDYYDSEKLSHIRNHSSIFTTLFQTTGVADDRMGFLNFTKRNGEMMFGSAVPGAPVVAQLVKVVITKPYNISVLQISAPIIPPGVDSTGKLAPPPAPTAAAPKKAPAPSPVDSPANAPAPDVTAPAPAEADALAPSPPSPVADAPADAPTDAPTAATADSPADGPGTADNEPKSSAGKVAVGASIGLAMWVVFLSVL